MANYHFHFQQHEDGHREDVGYVSARHAEPDYQQRAPALQFSQFAGHYESGYQRRVRPTQAPHITAVAARPSRPRRQRQRSRSRSTPSFRSRSRRRRRSRSTSSRSHRRRATSRSPSRRSRASRATRTTVTEMSPSVNVAQPSNPQYPAKIAKSPGAVPAAVTPCHPPPRVIPPETSPFIQAHFKPMAPLHLHTNNAPLPPHFHRHLHLHLSHLHLPRSPLPTARCQSQLHHHLHLHLLALHHQSTPPSTDLHIQRRHPPRCRNQHHHLHQQQQCHNPVMILDQ